MKILRIIVLVLTAAVAFSACESPSDVTDKQNVKPIGGLPIKSVSVEVEKAVKKEVNNSFKGVDLSTTLFPEQSYIDLNTKTPYLTLKLDTDIPLAYGQSGVVLNKFMLNINNAVADGRTYMLQGGMNTSTTAGAVFETKTSYNDNGQLRYSTNPLFIPGAGDSATIHFKHDPVNKAIIGNLTAYVAKDTVMRIPLSITSEQADSIYQAYTAMGFEIKDGMPNLDTVNNDLLLPAVQVLLNIHSTITISY
jgi:hypothetical protein